MSNTLLILNDAPYGTERSHNGLCLAQTLAKQNGEQVRAYLMGNAAACAKAGQKVPMGHYNIELMLGQLTREKGLIGVCGGCMDARGIGDNELVQGSWRSSMNELADWTTWADRILVF